MTDHTNCLESNPSIWDFYAGTALAALLARDADPESLPKLAKLAAKAADELVKERTRRE